MPPPPARCRYLDVVEFLVEQQAEVNTKKDNGWTPLHPHKSVTLARPNATFSCFCQLLPPLRPLPMPPRTPLGIIDGNRPYGHELTPNQRGKIEGAVAFGANYAAAGKLVDCTRHAARKTILLATERQDGHSKPRPGRPREWDSRFERRVLRIARMTPKTTYQQMREQLGTYPSHDTLARILDKNGLTNWISKQRPFLTLEAVKKRLRWTLLHKDWSYDEWAFIIWSDECSVERGAGARRTWVFRTPGQKWDKEIVDTYTKGKDISIMVWGAIWVGGRSDLFIMNRDETSKKQGYSAASYLEVLDDQLPTIWSPGMIFMQDNAPIHTAKVVKDWLQSNAIPILDWPPYSPDLNPN